MTADAFDIRPMPDNSSTIDTRSTWPAQVWLAWAVSAAAVIQLAPSPVYVALVIALSWLIAELFGRQSGMALAYPVILTIGASLALVRVLIAAATAHGSGAVIFTTPSFTVPRVLGGFTVGGAVDSTVVATAGAEAFAILGIIAVFAAFNTAVSHYELIQSAPRAFHELGVVVVLAVAIVPSTVMAITAANEATRARTGGSQLRRRRLLHLTLPVLETGLERATGLAESMDSRGFARRSASRSDALSAWLGLGALILAGCALIALVGSAQLAAAGLFTSALAALIGAVAAASAGSKRTLYRPRRLTHLDWIVIALVVLAPIGMAVAAGLDLAGASSLRWPKASLTWPEFAPLPALLHLLLLAPLLALARGNR
ncbi:MAG: hypothetical protein DCC49_10775 [Acidobacteria bacterium]|nr:MAG: hypothetical protein DCC49_10775 [Acidobacteriota bacterium]